jgi:chromosome segregation ATPase
MNEQQLRRLSDCEVHINKYHDRLDEYIRQCEHYSISVVMKDDYRKQWEEFNRNISRDFGMIRKDVLALIQENKVLSEKVNFNQTEHDQLLKAQYEETKKQKFHVEQLQKDNSISQVNHDYHKKDLSYLKLKVAECEKFYPELNKYKENHNILAKSHEENIAFLHKRIEEMSKQLQERKNSENTLIASMQQLQKAHEDKLAQLERKFEGHRQDTLSLINSASGQIQQKFDNLPKPVFPKIPQMDVTPQLEAFKKDMQDTISSSILDVSNAKTKSDVNEMQLKIMDKKLENIYLLLKKHDLSQ